MKPPTLGPFSITTTSAIDEFLDSPDDVGKLLKSERHILWIKKTSENTIIIEGADGEVFARKSLEDEEPFEVRRYELIDSQSTVIRIVVIAAAKSVLFITESSDICNEFCEHIIVQFKVDIFILEDYFRLEDQSASASLYTKCQLKQTNLIDKVCFCIEKEKLKPIVPIFAFTSSVSKSTDGSDPLILLHIVTTSETITLVPLKMSCSQIWCKRIRNLLNAQISIKNHNLFWFPMNLFEVCTCSKYLNSAIEGKVKWELREMMSRPKLHFASVERMSDKRNFIRVNRINQQESHDFEHSQARRWSDQFHSCQLTIPIEEINDVYVTPISFKLDSKTNRAVNVHLFMLCIQRRKWHYELFTNNQSVAERWSFNLRTIAALKPRPRCLLKAFPIDTITWNQAINCDLELCEALHRIAEEDCAAEKDDIEIPKLIDTELEDFEQHQEMISPQDHAIQDVVDKWISKFHNQINSFPLSHIKDYGKKIAKTANQIAGDTPRIRKMKEKFSQKRSPGEKDGTSSSSESSSSSSSDDSDAPTDAN